MFLLLVGLLVVAGKAETAGKQARKTKRGILLATAGSPVALDLASRHDGGFESNGFGLTGLADGSGTGQLSGGLVGGGAIVHQAPVLVQRYPSLSAPAYYYSRQSVPVVRDVHTPHQRPAAAQPPAVRLQASSQPISVSQHVNIPQTTVPVVSQSVPVVVSAVSSSSAGTGFSSRIDSSATSGGVAVAGSSGLASSGLAATDLGSRGLIPNLGYPSSGGIAALGGVGTL